MPNPDNKIANEGDLSIPKKIVRTYSSDLAKSVQEKGGEAYRIARVEQTIKDREAKIMAKQNKFNFIFGLGGLCLIFASLIALVYFYYKPKTILNPEPSAAARSIIFFDKQSAINVTGLDYAKILITYRKEIAESKMSSRDIENIIFTENGPKISLSRLFNLFRINPPKEASGFWAKDYFVGLFADTGVNWPFIILRTNSYRDISPFIIAWEDHMLDDLAAWLNIDVTGKNNYLLQNKFDDSIVSNKETRAIKNKNGEIVLMYLYLDENNILFARNKNTLDEVLIRLFSPKK